MRITSAGRVGIGTDTPDAKLHVYQGNFFVQQTSGAVYLRLIPQNNNYSYITFGDTVDENNGVISYENASSLSDDVMGFQVGNSRRVTITGNGDVGIGTTAPTVKLEVVETGTSSVVKIQNTAAEGEACLLIKGTDGATNATITGAGVGTFSSVSSDGRKKLILGDVPNCLSKLEKLPLKKYKWKKNFDPEETVAGKDEEHWGVIAQELEKIIPELVYSDDYGSKSLDPLTLTGLCIKSIQELSAKVKALESA